jgi:hypothetical protein
VGVEAAGQQQVGFPVAAAARLEEPVALLLDEREEKGEGGAVADDASRGCAADGGLSGCATTPRSSCAAQPSPCRLSRRFLSQLGPLLPLPHRPTGVA